MNIRDRHLRHPVQQHERDLEPVATRRSGFAVGDPTIGKVLAKLAITEKGSRRPTIRDAVGALVSTSSPAMIVRIA
ncbi:hypothetical protein OV142_29195 [Nannocystis sp. SCPEA4]|nr:hypothetical protein [Nannocystis sp. SCPEA4]